MSVVVSQANQAIATSPLHHTFAACVGRFSAEMEHAWLVNDPVATLLENQRLVFLSLLDATVPVGAERATLNRRVETKLAHAALLTTATFDDETGRAERAQRLAKRFVAECRALLLDS